MIRRLGIYLAPIILICLTLAGPSSTRASEGGSKVECMCSMISIIANPGEYDGKRIRTMGVAVIEFEGMAIYLSSENAEQTVFVNGIRLAIKETEELKALVHKKWVLVEGVYHRWEAGEGQWRGYLSDITLLYAPEDVKEAQ